MQKYEDYIKETQKEREMAMEDIMEIIRKEMEDPNDLESVAFVLQILLRYQKEMTKIAIQYFLKEKTSNRNGGIPMESYRNASPKEIAEQFPKNAGNIEKTLCDLCDRVAVLERLLNVNA